MGSIPAEYVDSTVPVSRGVAAETLIARGLGRISGLRPLRFHDLRHTYGSLLAAAGIDLITIQAAMGHSALSTTSRYLHARPASEQAEAFTHAFVAMSPSEALTVPSRHSRSHAKVHD